MACDLCRSLKQKCLKSESETACQRCSRGGYFCNDIVGSKRAEKSTAVQASNLPSSITPLIELPEVEQTSGKTSTSAGAAPSQVSVTSSTKTSASERSFEASNHPTTAVVSAETSLVQAIQAYNSHIQSAGQQQVEDNLRRLLDEKFSSFQKHNQKLKEEGWLKAIDQVCRAQESLADELRAVRLQLSRLEGLQYNAVPVNRSVTSSSHVGIGHDTMQPEQSVGSTGLLWDRVDNSGWMGSTTFSGNTFWDVGELMDPYSRR